MMLPPVLLLIDWFPLRRIISPQTAFRCAIEKTPFFALSLLTGTTAFLAKQTHGGMAPIEQYGLVERFGQAVYGIWFYLLKTVSPRHLLPLYEKHPECWQVLFSMVLLTVVLIFLFLFRHRLFPIIGTFGTFLILIFPMLGITQSGVQLYADRFTYFAAVSVSVLFSSGLSRVRVLRRTVYLAVSVFICIFALQTGTYAFVWGDEGRLWSRTVMEDDASAIGHNELGLVFLDQAEYEEALVHFQRANQLNPRSAMVLHNAALALAGFKRYHAALEKWDEAASLTRSVKETCKIMLARGWACEQMGDSVHAEQIYDDLIELAGADPMLCAKALQLRAVLKIKDGRIGSALPDLQRILDLPVSSEKKEKVSSVLRELKKIPEAEASGIF